MTIEGITSLFQTMKSPLLIFLLCLFFLLAYIIIAQQKTLREHLTYERELMNQLGENSSTLARLTALIETLVHGRGGSR